jgi:4-amino-4-deoxy-L-arabinose transferase-like glycosyltransferase
VRLPTLPTWLWIALAALLIVVIEVATITACGPWDPWETHYGEVARQILVRHDPLDLWWRPGYGPDGNAENTFWSKPALPFWLMALSMAMLGVGSRPEVDEMVRSPWPEVAIRLPSLISGLLCAVFLGYVVWRLLRDETRRRSGAAEPMAARAGIFTAVVLATMPQWAIVTRQALTDMFLVMPVVVALGAWALAWLQPDRAAAAVDRGAVAAAGRGSGWRRVRRWTSRGTARTWCF